MDILKNEMLKKYIAQMSLLKDDYSKESNTVNSYFWPLIAQNNRQLKNQLYYTGSMGCLLVLVVVIILLGGIKNEYLLWGSIAICVALIMAGVIVTSKTFKKKKIINIEWENNNKKVLKIKEEIQNVTKKAMDEVCYIICYNENIDKIKNNELDEKSLVWQNLLQNVKEKMNNYTQNSDAYEDVIGYYDYWANEFLKY